jgi:CHAD domain-containing protein
MVMLTPSALVQRHLDVLLGHLPGCLNGEVESVHQARIATRRLREVLPLLADGHLEGTVEKVREAGRCLGRVRELDVMSSLLERASERVVPANGMALVARRALRDRQRRARRTMVKALERLDLEGLRNLFAHPRGVAGWSTGPKRLLRGPDWIEPLWTRIAERSADAVAAARRAPGIYLPNRSHQTRVAVKKLRYAVEVAAETGLWRPPHLLKDLQRIQGALGQIHDAQVLADALDSLIPDSPGSTEATPIRDVLQAEIDGFHAEYMKRRDRIFVIGEVCARAAADGRAAWTPRRTLIVASAVAAPLLLFGRHAGHRRDATAAPQYAHK